MLLVLRAPDADLEFIVGYPPQPAGFRAAYLVARRQMCSAEPRIVDEVQARATTQAHMHHVGSPCLQARGALVWMCVNGYVMLSSQFDRAAE
jgi:hypothetical protein